MLVERREWSSLRFMYSSTVRVQVTTGEYERGEAQKVQSPKYRARLG